MGKTVTVDGVLYRQVAGDESRIAIVVCDRGFVLVGDIAIEDDYLVIENCNCIRVWGTSRGLGEIASGGPTSKTSLDPQPTTKVHELQVVQIIDCESEKWNL